MRTQKQKDVRLIGAYPTYGAMLRAMRNRCRHTRIDWQTTRECANVRILTYRDYLNSH